MCHINEIGDIVNNSDTHIEPGKPTNLVQTVTSRKALGRDTQQEAINTLNSKIDSGLTLGASPEFSNIN